MVGWLSGWVAGCLSGWLTRQDSEYLKSLSRDAARPFPEAITGRVSSVWAPLRVPRLPTTNSVDLRLLGEEGRRGREEGRGAGSGAWT